MRKSEGKITGILGAIIIHLVAAIIFMVVQIGSLKITERKKEYQIALEELPEAEKKEKPADNRLYSVEKIFQGDQEVLNIARNLANQPDVKINAEDYIDKVKEELIESGKLGKDNYIDEQKKARENKQDGDVSLLKKEEGVKEPDKPKDSQEIAAKFSGPTRIYYYLPGRTHTYLPIPIYKCEGSGKVVLKIEVNSKGVVISAKIIETESTTNDPCLIETAVSAALISKFNPDINAQKTETGTLTYHFVAQ
jgi:TonB family protein